MKKRARKIIAETFAELSMRLIEEILIDYIATITIGSESAIKSPHVKHGVNREDVCMYTRPHSASAPGMTRNARMLENV